MILGVSLSVYSQSPFSKGYEKGYKEGYCYGKTIGCISPISPVSPMTKMNESPYSYKDGYNRGFLDGKKKSIKNTNTSPYGRRSYTPDYKPFKPDLKQLQMVLRARQQSLNNNSRTYPTNKENVSLYDYLLGDFGSKHRSLRPKLSNYNSQTRKAILAKQLFYSFKSYPFYISKGEHRATAIVFDSNRNVKFVDNNAHITIDQEKLVSMIFFSDNYSRNNTPILSYSDAIREGMENTLNDLNNSSLTTEEINFSKNFKWKLITFQQKPINCLSEILVQEFYSDRTKAGNEYSLILLFNDTLLKSNNRQKK